MMTAEEEIINWNRISLKRKLNALIMCHLTTFRFKVLTVTFSLLGVEYSLENKIDI